VKSFIVFIPSGAAAFALVHAVNNYFRDLPISHQIGLMLVGGALFGLFLATRQSMKIKKARASHG